MTLLQRDRENIELRHPEGSEQMASLAMILLSENRIEDLKCASDDIGFRKELFEEYGIL